MAHFTLDEPIPVRSLKFQLLRNFCGTETRTDVGAGPEIVHLITGGVHFIQRFLCIMNRTENTMAATDCTFYQDIVSVKRWLLIISCRTMNCTDALYFPFAYVTPCGIS